MKRVVGLVVVLSWCTCSFAFAEHQGRGRGKGTKKAPEDRAERIANEVVDAVVEEAVGEQTQSGLPPGLSKRGHLPPGLEKQGKTPPGWSKGTKEGWGDGKKDSPLRKLIRGVLGRGKGTPPPEKTPDG
jgi:hypothetical protein